MKFGSSRSCLFYEKCPKDVTFCETIASCWKTNRCEGTLENTSGISENRECFDKRDADSRMLELSFVCPLKHCAVVALMITCGMSSRC